MQEAYKYGLLAVLLWSTVATAFKIGLQHLSPTEMVFYSSLFSTLFLVTVVIYQKKISAVVEHIKKSFKYVLILGFINPFLYYLVLFKAYDLLPAQEAQAINYTWALMLSFLSVVFLKQKLTLSDVVAGFICYFGVLVISTKGDIVSLEFSSVFGVSLALLSTILWASYWIVNTKIKADPIVGLTGNFLVAMPIVALYYFLTQPLNTPTIEGLLSGVYIGLFEMGFTFMLWLKAMKVTTSTSKIANLIFLSPFLSLVFIYFLLGEKIYLATIVGLVLIILGLILQQRGLLNKKIS